jgi:sulfur-oxidizing protein SoxZ
MATAAARTVITLPTTARRGEVVELRTLIAHAMETGYRVGDAGQVLPRDILRRFECRLDGELVFAADLAPAISANPYLAFTLQATRSGTLSFAWTGDNGFAWSETRPFTVT